MNSNRVGIAQRHRDVPNHIRPADGVPLSYANSEGDSYSIVSPPKVIYRVSAYYLLHYALGFTTKPSYLRSDIL